MNTKTCGDCEHYDPILRGTRPTPRGWCAKKSVYPYMDSPGQVTPQGVQRVPNPEDPAKPVIVEQRQVKADCTLFTVRRSKMSKADLIAKALGKGK